MITLSRLAGLALSLQASAHDHQTVDSVQWIGSWATAPQSVEPSRRLSLRNQTLRLIAHTSIGGRSVRIRLSNVYGERPLLVGSAHIARRASGADVDAASDRALT